MLLSGWSTLKEFPALWPLAPQILQTSINITFSYYIISVLQKAKVNFPVFIVEQLFFLLVLFCFCFF